MNKSESIKELAIALNKAQAEMSGAKKQAENPFFKSKYANLEEIINCLKEPFHNNGLSYSQIPIAKDGFAGCETIFMHISGEWLSGELLLKCSKNDPQGMGSAISYSKRYMLQSMAGLPSEDDDGNGATKPEKKTPSKKPVKPPKVEHRRTEIKLDEYFLGAIRGAKDSTELIAQWNAIPPGDRKLYEPYKNARKKELGI